MSPRQIRRIGALIGTSPGWARYADVPDDELVGRVAYQLERLGDEACEAILAAFESPDVALDAGSFLAAVEERAIETSWLPAIDRDARGLVAVFSLPHPVRARRWRVTGFSCWGATKGEEGMLIITEARP